MSRLVSDPIEFCCQPHGRPRSRTHGGSPKFGSRRHTHTHTQLTTTDRVVLFFPFLSTRYLSLTLDTRAPINKLWRVRAHASASTKRTRTHRARARSRAQNCHPR
ncbi:unnamed protein product [Ixodes pacificus]